MALSEASTSHETREVNAGSRDAHNGPCSNGRGSWDALAKPTPTLVHRTTNSLNGVDSLREKNDGVPMREVSHVLLEEMDTAVTEEGGREAKEEEKEKKEENGVPYDRGWSWMLVLAMFVNFFVLAGYIKSSGLFFVELLNKFNAPATHTALFFAIRSAVFSVSGMYVMNVLLELYGSRRLVFAGGILTALSAILSSVTNELTLLICIYSILLALGMSMMISPGEVLIGHYFKKRRSLALSLAKCGASIGNVAIPPLISYLLAEYGLSGTLLLCGGVCLHSLPAAMLLRPTSFYTKRQSGRICRTSSGVGYAGSGPQPLFPKQVNDDGAHDKTTELMAPKWCQSDPENIGAYQQNVTCYVSEDASRGEGRKQQEGLLNKSERVSLFVSAAVAESSGVKFNAQLPTTQGPMTCPTQLDKLTADLGAFSASNPEMNLVQSPDVPFRKRTYSEPPERFDQVHGKAAVDSLNILDAISQSCMVRYMSVTSLDAPMGLLPQISSNRNRKPSSAGRNSVKSASGIVVKQFATSDNNSPKTPKNCCVRLLSSLCRCPMNLIFMLDFSLFRRPLFRLLMFYMMFCQFINMVLDYLPAVAKEKGLTESQAALLLSIIGGLDLVCRLLCGFLADTKVLRVPTMIIIAQVVLAVVTQFVRFMTSFHHFVVLAVFQGLFGGVGNCLIAVLIIEFVGLEKMGKGMGFCQLVMGAAMAAIYPFLGYVRDVTGSFTTVFHLIGLGMLVGAGLLCLEGPVRRLESRSQHKAHTPTQDSGPDFELVVNCDSKI